jgi:ATP-dependent exoDNAse (exonuclease V) alpha subunit
MKSKLEKQSINFKAVAPTNKATLEIGGETLHKFSYGLLTSKKQLKKFNAVKYLFVDEISMIPEIFYQVLMMLKHYNEDLKIIMVGDFNQLPPVNDRVCKRYEMTRALYELVDGNKLELTKCKRSDDTHFKNCMNIRDGKAIDLQKFKHVDETYLNISFTNECRKKINQACMERYIKEKTPKKTMKFDPLKFDKNSQEITICEGMPIIARINHRKLDIINNESFTISKIKDDAVYVSNEVKKDIEIPVEKFNRFFYLAFCITIHKSQGATFREKYTIHEWNKQCRKMKYVAISRATDEKNVQIVL